ncbi:sulfite exporter TauE/SafE family protein [Deinococcus sp.]|uniref:sulfite exporter TauE/SafE family protein n=1 Tax=Deinococcus sp. TaxID=47478 RepID=UPI002869EAE7|nr:sulfite exporter TauE/SafE family protein [Deinococcus sp.]
MIFAWIGAALIGLSLGLLGSGGSILTVPVLVYLVGEDSKLAIAESLAIVGSISAFGALNAARQGRVDWRTVALFGLPGMVGTFIGSALSAKLHGVAQLTLFAVVMLLAATFMFRPALPSGPQAAGRANLIGTAARGLGVGVLTGVVGVGGGFLIIPALVLLGGLPMELAVGTSLAIITLNSVTGLLKHAQQLTGDGGSLNWHLIALFSVIGIAGSVLGARIGAGLSALSLRRGFAVFLVAMGAYVLAMNAPKLIHPTVQTQAEVPVVAAR